MKIKISLLCALLACAPCLQAAAKKAPGSSPAPNAAASPAASTAPKAPRAIPYRGMISAVDTKAKTFTIAGKEKSRVFKITTRSVLTKAGAAATMKDVVANEEVRGSYWKDDDGSLEAKSVKLGPLTEEEKAAAAKKHSKKKKAAAEEASESPAASPAKQ